MIEPPAISTTTVAPAEAWAFCHRILPDVSRTFALNIPVLPARLRDAVCCAYLLCRIADTIEDTEPLAAELRDELYDGLYAAVEPARPANASPFGAEWAAAASDAYARLVAGTPLVLAAFASLPREQRVAIAACVREMISGMRMLGERPRVGGVRFVCDDLAGLDAYCHFVAGTVGVMLTRLFAAETQRPAEAATLERGRRFGLGLQAVNIIKDHVDDVERGTCFVPRECAAATNPPGIRPEARATLIRHALSHLDEAMRFVTEIPAEAEGIRLFCVWALMLALGTLREAAGSGTRTPKVGRDEVARILTESRRVVGDNERLAGWFAAYREQVTSALAQSGTDGASSA